MPYMDRVKTRVVIDGYVVKVDGDLADRFVEVGHAHERTTACIECGASVLPEMFQTHSDWHDRMEVHDG